MVRYWKAGNDLKVGHFSPFVIYNNVGMAFRFRKNDSKLYV